MRRDANKTAGTIEFDTKWGEPITRLWRLLGVGQLVGVEPGSCSAATLTCDKAVS